MENTTRQGHILQLNTMDAEGSKNGNGITFTPEQLDGFEVNRCYRGKIQYSEGDEVSHALWLTHTLFNEKVALVCKHIFRVLNDKSNPEFSKLTRWAIENITPAGQCSTHFANPFTLETSRANPTHLAYNKQEEMRFLFSVCKERGDRWYDRNEVFGELIQGRGGGSGMVAEVNQAAIEKLSGYLALVKNWREGKSTPITLLSEEQFVKKLLKFLKDYRELLVSNWQKEIDSDATDKDTELYEILLHSPKKEQERLLKEMYRNRFEFGWLVDELDGLYQSYNNEALGKKDWLKQKQYFDASYPEFKTQYEQLVSCYRQEFENHKHVSMLYPSQRWVRDPNFLRMLEVHGKDIFPNFCSPMSDIAFQAAWEKFRENTEFPEKPWDCSKGRDLFVETLKSLNPDLFKATGWFKLFERYSKLQRFSRPPQFRYPDPVMHPEWINFSESGCFQYRNPKVIGPARLEITVNLIDPNTSNAWKAYPLEVSLDHRLTTLGERQLVQVPEGRWGKTLTNERIFDWKVDETGALLYKTDHYYPWADSEGEIQWIQIHGGNLIHRKDFFYLHFRYTYKTPKKPKLRDESAGAYNYQPGTRLLGVDQGQKDDVIVTIMELTKDGKLQQVPFKPFVFKKHKQKPRRDGKLSGGVYYQWIKLPGGTSFKAVAHAEKVRSQRRKSVKRKESAYLKEKHGEQVPMQGNTSGRFLTRGQVFDKNLKNYIEHCRELHYKTVAGVLFKLAKENGCQGIVMENLNSYKVTLKQDRFQNSRLMTWAMQKKTAFLETLCDSGQLNFIQKSAAYTSQTCNHCESFGARFNFPNTKEWERYKKNGKVSLMDSEKPYPIVDTGGDWFICSNPRCYGKKEPENPNTRYTIQADANAAKNLLTRAFLKRGWGTSPGSKEERKQLQEQLQDWLITRYARQSVMV